MLGSLIFVSWFVYIVSLDIKAIRVLSKTVGFISGQRVTHICVLSLLLFMLKIKRLHLFGILPDVEGSILLAVMALVKRHTDVALFMINSVIIYTPYKLGGVRMKGKGQL